MASAITKKDEIRFIHYLSQKEIFHNALSFDDAITLISNNEIQLEVENDQSTVLINKENIEDIEKTMPFLLRIADKPKSFIILHEEKVPVETAKRINHHAIMKLSRDSNDWHARTLLSIKPKNISADINEETFNIYENRFVVTLIDRIAFLLKDAKAQYQLQKRRYEQERMGAKIKDYFHTADNFEFLNEINKGNIENGDTADIIQELSDIIERIIVLERKTKIFINSKLYQSLRKCRRVKNPIQKTNILMFSPEYNAAYKLWNNLITAKVEHTLDSDEKFDCSNSFKLYALLNIFAALKDMGFEEKTKSTFEWDDSSERLKFSDEFIFGNSTDKLRLNYREHFELRIIKQSKPVERWGLINIFTDFTDFEGMSKLDVDNKTIGLLNGLILPKKKYLSDELTAQYCFVSTELLRTEDTAPLNRKIYQRFYSYGDHFSDEENVNDIENWGNHKTGLINISPLSLKTNFLRLERFLNVWLLSNRHPSTFETSCPICGGHKIINNGDDTFVCKSCQHIYSRTYCSNCDDTHKNPIMWIKYADEKFLDDPDVIVGDFEKNLITRQLSDIEFVLGKYSVTNFDLVKEKNGYKLKTICPHCSKQLGSK